MIIPRKPPRTSQTLVARLRSTSPFAAVFLLFACSLAGSLYVIERFYNEAKWSLIQGKAQRQVYIDHNTVPAQLAVRAFVDSYYSWKLHPAPVDQERARARNAERSEQLRRQAIEQVQAMVDRARVVVASDFVELDGTVVFRIEHPERLRHMHWMGNSLLTRSFQRSMKQTMTATVATNQGRGIESVAAWNIYITTADDDPEILALTTQYWRVVFVTVAVLVALFYMVIKFTLAPVRRVVVFMERRDERRSYLIPHPSNHLERAYNNLARDAALTRLSKELRESIANQGLSHAQPMLAELPALLDDILMIPTAEIWTFHHAEGRWVLDKCHGAQSPAIDRDAFRAQLAELVAEDPPEAHPEYWRNRILQFPDPTLGSRPWFCDVLDLRTEHLWLLVIHGMGPNPAPTPWWVDYCARISNELRYALSSVEDQRRLILQEKSKANISLSRNLGHDLTNIIATSKLELMTVRTLLAQGPGALADSPTKAKIFAEALQALLNNTRFLQEIVNLYRSFSYLQKPMFEDVDIGDLVNDVSSLYRLTLSTAFRITVAVEGPLPRVVVEPRLLRLALFNILTNAVDAIKRSGGEEKPEGTIAVVARLLAREHLIEIEVTDTGPGIRDAEGNLLTAEALAEIFRLGYTTKANQEGEGLGLNWVQSIVRDFHNGEVIARNSPAGGAVFSLHIPTVHEPIKPPGAPESTTAPKGREHP